jgi:hypothetical protein
MWVVVGLAFGLIALGAAIQFELRSACCGVVLSNGVEVMVSAEMYRSIVARYRSQGGSDPEPALGLELEPEPWQRWDRAVLDVLRLERPNEWRFLVRSLGRPAVAESHLASRQRQTVRRGSPGVYN